MSGIRVLFVGNCFWLPSFWSFFSYQGNPPWCWSWTCRAGAEHLDLVDQMLLPGTRTLNLEWVPKRNRSSLVVILVATAGTCGATSTSQQAGDLTTQIPSFCSSPPPGSLQPLNTWAACYPSPVYFSSRLESFSTVNNFSPLNKTEGKIV